MNTIFCGRSGRQDQEIGKRIMANSRRERNTLFGNRRIEREWRKKKIDRRDLFDRCILVKRTWEVLFPDILMIWNFQKRNAEDMQRENWSTIHSSWNIFFQSLLSRFIKLWYMNNYK